MATIAPLSGSPTGQTERQTSGLVRRATATTFALVAYCLFFGSISYYFLFLAGALVPKTVDAGALHLGRALPLDLLLIALFGAQHSVMARAGCKRRLARVLPQGLERSAFVLASALVLIFLLVAWQPEPAVIWRLARPLESGVARGLFWGGVALAVASTYVFSHTELFGLAQAHAYVNGTAPAPAEFRVPPLYRVVRHPMHLGMLVALWATPLMTAGHLVLALGMTSYVLVGIHFEERDLIRQFGEPYRQYRRAVPALLPLPRLHPVRGSVQAQA